MNTMFTYNNTNTIYATKATFHLRLIYDLVLHLDCHITPKRLVYITNHVVPSVI